MISGWRPCTPESNAASSPAERIFSSISWVTLATISSMRPGWMRPSEMRRSRLMRATSRRTGLKARQDHRFGGVVDDDIHPGGGLQGPDVAALPADDAPFHFFVGEGHHAHGLLGHVVAGVAPDGQGGDFPGLAGGGFPGLGIDALHHAGGLGAHFPFHGTEARGLWLPGRSNRRVLQGGHFVRVIIAGSVPLFPAGFFPAGLFASFFY